MEVTHRAAPINKNTHSRYFVNAFNMSHYHSFSDTENIFSKFWFSFIILVKQKNVLNVCTLALQFAPVAIVTVASRTEPSVETFLICAFVKEYFAL